MTSDSLVALRLQPVGEVRIKSPSACGGGCCDDRWFTANLLTKG